MSKTILTIKVNLTENASQKIIKFEIKDEVDNITEEVIMQDDSKESFQNLTKSLTNCVKTVRKALPHKQVGLFGSKIEPISNAPIIIKDDKFNIENSNILEPFKSMLIKLRDKNKADESKVLPNINKIIDDIVDEKEIGIGADKDDIKIYIKERVNTLSSIFLGYHTIDGKEQKPVFLTKDGIITDGFAILPLNADGIKEVQDVVTITDPGWGPFGGYMSSLKIANKTGPGVFKFGSETEYDYAKNQLKEKGTYASKILSGGKTKSKRYNQQRKITRRIR